MDASAERFARLLDEQIRTVYGFFAYLLLHRWHAEVLTRRTFEYAFSVWDGEELDRDARAHEPRSIVMVCSMSSRHSPTSRPNSSM